MSNTLVYSLEGKIYINLTNRCTNECIFCIRQDKDNVCGQPLWLENEDITSDDVIEQLKNFQLSDEIIFCGYGEPLLKFDTLKQVAKYIKENYPNVKIRVNTNGHANFVYKTNIVPQLKGLVDEFSISLNAPDKFEYDELSQPKFDNAYDEVKKFIKCCTDEKIPTTASVVEGFKGRHINLEKCEQISKDLGAKFRVREWIENGY